MTGLLIVFSTTVLMLFITALRLNKALEKNKRALRSSNDSLFYITHNYSNATREWDEEKYNLLKDLHKMEEDIEKGVVEREHLEEEMMAVEELLVEAANYEPKYKSLTKAYGEISTQRDYLFNELESIRNSK